MNWLQVKYNGEVKRALQQQFQYQSAMQIPQVEKIVLNMTAGRDVTDSKVITQVASDLALIAGQKPIPTIAKKSLAAWKLREGMPMGSKVTLRRDKMWNFLDKLINVVIPRVRDFRGINNNAFDGRGNFALGLQEHIIFPEINFDQVTRIRGLDVIVVTSAPTDDEARSLLRLLGMPFKGKKG